VQDASQRSPVSRGDLLRVLHAAKAVANSPDLSLLLGYERTSKGLTHTVTMSEIRCTYTPPAATPSPPGLPLQAPMLGAVLLDQPPALAGQETSADAQGPLQTLTHADWGAAPGAASSAPGMPPIVPRSRLLPALDRALRVQRLGGIDVASWVDALSRRQPPRQQARHKVQRLAPQRVLVLDMDFDGAMAAYRHDMAWLVHSMQRPLGGEGFQVRWLVRGSEPLAGWLDVTPSKAGHTSNAAQPALVQDWLPLTPDTQVLLFSDMGLSASGANTLPAPWAQWLKQVQSQGARVQVWSPVPLQASNLIAAHAALPVVHWSAASTLRPQPLGRGRAHSTPQRQQLAQDVLAMLSFCGFIDAHLVRAMRLAMGAAGLDAGLEQLVWQSPDLTRGAASRRMHTSRLGQHRSAFAQLPAPTQLQVQQLATAYYSGFSVPLAHMHTLGWVTRARSVPTQVHAQEVAAKEFANRLSAAPGTTGLLQAEAAHFLQTWLLHADAQEQAHHGHLRGGLSVALLGLQGQPATAAHIPAGLPHAALAQRLAPGAVAKPHWLVQDARTGQVLLGPTPPVAGPSPLLPIALPLATADVEPAPGAPRQWLALGGQAATVVAQRPGKQALLLRSSELAVCVAPVQRPRGVVAWHRSAQGLHLRGAPLGALALRAGPSQIGLLAPLRLHQVQNLRLEVPPQQQGSTAISFGVHAQHGLYLDLKIAGVVQRLIWIEPTGPQGFLMGSSQAERDRIADSDIRDWAKHEGPQHPVRLSQGYWLADTPCTQALWLAVVGGKNPSHFGDKSGWQDRPVEQVNVEDVQGFLRKLQTHLPTGSQAALPTEAQWEYACRAGTQTAFWWGDEFDESRANAGGKTTGTTPVKQYEPNPWGLRDMHGNVWQWCADGDLRPYTGADPIDPQGLTGVATRVVRGGSWGSRPASARAASRFAGHPGNRSHDQGFRFALRSTGPGGAVVGSGVEAGGRPVLRPEGAAPGFLDRVVDALRKKSTKK
jgi:formylglycine-generating enzyme required for sulfatase activity